MEPSATKRRVAETPLIDLIWPFIFDDLRAPVQITDSFGRHWITAAGDIDRRGRYVEIYDGKGGSRTLIRSDHVISIEIGALRGDRS